MSLVPLLDYFELPNPSINEILPIETLTDILVSKVPYWEHSTCSQVCRKWKEILDDAPLSEEYKTCIDKVILQCEIKIERLNLIKARLAKGLQTNSEKFLADVGLGCNYFFDETEKFTPTVYHQIHIINGSYNYKWICEKFASIRDGSNQSQENVEKAIKIYDSNKARYDKQENNHLINRFLRNVLENISSPLLSFNKQHLIVSLQELTSRVESFIKQNLFTANKQFVCLFSDPRFFIRLLTDNIFEEPKHFQDDSEVKLCAKYFGSTEKFSEINMYDREAKGKWYVFLHGRMPTAWSNGIVECVRSVTSLQRLSRQEQKSKNRALEIKDDSEPVLKKAREI